MQYPITCWIHKDNASGEMIETEPHIYRCQHCGLRIQFDPSILPPEEWYDWNNKLLSNTDHPCNPICLQCNSKMIAVGSSRQLLDQTEMIFFHCRDNNKLIHSVSAYARQLTPEVLRFTQEQTKDSYATLIALNLIENDIDITSLPKGILKRILKRILSRRVIQTDTLTDQEKRSAITYLKTLACSGIIQDLKIKENTISFKINKEAVLEKLAHIIKPTNNNHLPV